MIVLLGRVRLRLRREGKRKVYTGLYGITAGPESTVHAAYDQAVPTADGRTGVYSVSFGVVACSGLAAAVDELDREEVDRLVHRHLVADLTR